MTENPKKIIVCPICGSKTVIYDSGTLICDNPKCDWAVEI